MRHAKSNWADSGLSDFDRPLNARGKKDAPKMGANLKVKGFIPDLILSSPAKRAKTTAELFAKTNTYTNKIEFVRDFYFGGSSEITNKILNTKNSIETLMIVGHNPTMDEIVMTFSKDNEYLPMKTATVVVFSSEIEKWSDLQLNSCKLELYLKPKDL